MPKMEEIYKQYALQYDKLVEAEDYERRLDNYLLDNIEWDGKIVFEAGIGTGRLSRIYLSKIKKLYGFDRENHMLQQCKKNLIEYSNKIIIGEGKNEEFLVIDEKADIFIEGWSFGHTIVENCNDIEGTTKKLLDNINRNTTNNEISIIIETLGTNVKKPIYIKDELKEFYLLLEEEYGYKRTIIETDYKFPNYNEAAEILGFFFGEEMGKDILRRKTNTVQEYTGIWIKDYQIK